MSPRVRLTDGVFSAGNGWIARSRQPVPVGFVVVEATRAIRRSGHHPLTHIVETGSFGTLAVAVARGKARTLCQTTVTVDWSVVPRRTPGGENVRITCDSCASALALRKEAS